MDYQVNGIQYLVINSDDNDDNDDNNDNNDNNNNDDYDDSDDSNDNKSFEYKSLLNWLIYHNRPTNKKEVKEIKKKLELYLNYKLYDWEYDNIDFSEFDSLIIPEHYLRYKKLLDIKF